jgi:hypothetical protein
MHRQKAVADDQVLKLKLRTHITGSHQVCQRTRTTVAAQTLQTSTRQNSNPAVSEPFDIMFYNTKVMSARRDLAPCPMDGNSTVQASVETGGTIFLDGFVMILHVLSVCYTLPATRAPPHPLKQA